MITFKLDYVSEHGYCVCQSPDNPGMDGSSQIEKFQEKALMELQDYVQKTYPDDTYRYNYLLFTIQAFS